MFKLFVILQENMFPTPKNIKKKTEKATNFKTMSKLTIMHFWGKKKYSFCKIQKKWNMKTHSGASFLLNSFLKF